MWTIEDLTFALVIATVVLGIASCLQVYWMKQHAKHLSGLASQTQMIATAANTSAEAAKRATEISATMLSDVERPWVVFSQVSFDTANGWTSFYVKNTGRTPAFLTARRFTHQMGPLPELALFNSLTLPAHAVISPGDAVYEWIGERLSIAPGQLQHLICAVEYLDQLKRAHRSVQVWTLREREWVVTPADEPFADQYFDFT